MQFVASPMPAGTYTIKIQALVGGGAILLLAHKTLSVLRSEI